MQKGSTVGSMFSDLNLNRLLSSHIHSQSNTWDVVITYYLDMTLWQFQVHVAMEKHILDI
jgi:hypothetical protein